MTALPDQYVVEKFCQYTGYPKFNKRSKVWAGGCPMCREGTSWGKKRRLYYKLEKNYIVCFNCGWKGGPVDYIKQVTGMSYSEILNDSNQYDTNNIVRELESEKPAPVHNIPSLPDDSINLFDEVQVNYWLGESNTHVLNALNFIKKRKLDVAINRPKSIWLSLDDYTHKNRIIIPFYDTSGKIIFYQSRSIYKDPSRPKYLSKTGGDKSIFNINQIDKSVDDVYIFEGPIDSCFVKNGIAIAGITNSSGDDLNHIQQQQLEDLRLYNKVWVLDSQWLDRTSHDKTNQLIDRGYNMFIWPESIGSKHKDINDLCTAINQPGIGYKYIKKHSYSGMKAKMLMSRIPRRY